jgi:superfamily II DNA or RNA helicase
LRPPEESQVLFEIRQLIKRIDLRVSVGAYLAFRIFGLVHRTELLWQWQKRLNTFLGIGQGVVRTIGEGKRKPTGKIDIAVMESLSRKHEVDLLVEGYGQVIVDECRHVGAVSLWLRRRSGRVSSRGRWPEGSGNA